MKRIARTAIAALTAFTVLLAGCASSTNDNSTDSSNQKSEEVEVSTGQTITVDEFSINVPAEWTVKDADDGYYIYPDYGGMLYVSKTVFTGSVGDANAAYPELIGGLEEDGTFNVSDEFSHFSMGSGDAFRSELEATIDGNKYKGWLEVIFCDDHEYTAMFLVPEDISESKSDEIVDIYDTIDVRY